MCRCLAPGFRAIDKVENGLEGERRRWLGVKKELAFDKER